jgi:hypothetical protein
MIANILSLLFLLSIGGGVFILGIWVFLHFFDD